MTQITKRIVEIPNSGIIEALKLVEEMAYKGYKCNLDHRSLFLNLGPSLLDVELVFTKETPKEETKEIVNTHKDLLNAIDNHFNIDVEDYPDSEEEEEFSTGSKYNENDFQIETKIPQPALEKLVSTEVNKKAIISVLENTAKHSELKEIANKYNLTVDKKLRNPAALRKNLIKQVESQ